MKLFSKRNPKIRREDELGYNSRFYRPGRSLISSEIRHRLAAEIKFLTSRNDFLEWFILFENEKEEKIFFDKNKIDNFSLLELGYQMSDFFEFEDFKIVQHEQKVRVVGGEERMEKYFDDYKLFDLVEIIILFAKDDKRKEVIKRFNAIFSEENADYQIVEHLITKKSGETLRTLVTLLRDENLRKKIESYFDLQDSQDYTSTSKLSADILNIIFSGYIKNSKPKDISDIKDRLAQKIVKGTVKKEDKAKRFLSYIDELLKSSKNLSNDIYDVRHTEKSTIEITNDNIYKLISNLNMSLVELVLTTLKDDYVLGDNWEKIKEDYIKKYKIDTQTRLIIKKPETSSDIDVDDLPF